MSSVAITVGVYLFLLRATWPDLNDPLPSQSSEEMDKRLRTATPVPAPSTTTAAALKDTPASNMKSKIAVARNKRK